jgi:hypothetical protein
MDETELGQRAHALPQPHDFERFGQESKNFSEPN